MTKDELREKAKLTLVSATSIVEGGAHDVLLKDTSNSGGRKASIHGLQSIALSSFFILKGQHEVFRNWRSGGN